VYFGQQAEPRSSVLNALNRARRMSASRVSEIARNEILSDLSSGEQRRISGHLFREIDSSKKLCPL